MSKWKVVSKSSGHVHEREVHHIVDDRKTGYLILYDKEGVEIAAYLKLYYNLHLVMEE